MAQTDIRFTFELAYPRDTEETPEIKLDVLSFTFEESLNEAFLLDVELVSHDAAIDFNALIDKPVLFTIWKNDVAMRRIHGLVSNFEQGETGHQRTHYHAIVEPVLARTQLCSDWRIFQQKNVPEILAELFKTNQITNHQIHAEREHLAREYCVQPGCTDHDFIQRLAAEEGFVYTFEHTKSAHQLIMTDVIFSLGSMTTNLDGSTVEAKEEGQEAQKVDPVLYQPAPAGDAPQPALRSFVYSQRVRTAQQTQREYTFKHPLYSQEQSAYGSNMTGQSNRYERYDYPGRYKQDAAGKPFTQTRIQSLRNDAKVAICVGDDSRLESGKAFKLSGHPREDMNTWWRPVHIIHTGKQHTAAEEEAASAQTSISYEQTAELVLATDNWKADIPEKHIIHGPLIAHITGPEGEEIYTDEFGRVKVQFPWDRQGKNDEHSSCWIRVAQNWASAGWGHMAIPRVGDEVILSFLDGDIDQPIIIGRTYDAIHPTPYKLPALKTQQTVKSKEHKGRGYNELLIDDTTGEIKTQLHTTYQATQLTMGYLTHPRDTDGNGEGRGEGFELRTDAWGAIRAGNGLYISTDKREKAEGKQLDLQEAVTQLEQAASITESLRKAAQIAKSELADLQSQKEIIQSTLKELKKAGLVINSPEGVGISSPKLVQAHAGENLFFTSGKQIDLSSINNLTINAGETLSMLGVNAGVKLFALQGDMNIEAQHNKMNLTSVNDMTIMSTQGRTEVTAQKELLLSCGGSYLLLKAGHIELGSTAPLMVRTPGLNVTGPNTIEKTGPGFDGIYQEFFVLKDKETGRILPYARYEITTEDGETYQGRADKDGRTITYHTGTPQKISVKILP